MRINKKKGRITFWKRSTSKMIKGEENAEELEDEK
jgi:hypothetical protein